MNNKNASYSQNGSFYKKANFLQTTRFLQTMRLGTSKAEIAKAAALLHHGGLVAFPTETVYGLGADATNPQAVAKIYAAKGRPHFNPLIAHVRERDAAYALGVFTPLALRLAEAFWPGPMTLVVPIEAGCPICDLARAGLESIAIRVPAHPVAQDLLKRVGVPLVAPSANRSGHVSPTNAVHVLDDLDGLIDAVIEGGDSSIGLESTILACMGDEITLLRSGTITVFDVERIIGKPVLIAQEEDVSPSLAISVPLAPGQLASHYAPSAALRLDASSVAQGEACLAFGAENPPGATAALTYNLSQKGDLTEAAANLYKALRALDRLNPAGICVVPLPEGGIGAAIKDRLIRAAAPRE